MQRSSSTSTVLIILLFTFPLWIGLGAGLFGLIAGLFAGLVGLIVGLIGAVIGVVAAIFKALFGWGGYHDWHFNGPDLNAFTWFTLLIIGALIISRRNKSK
jgi:hypothetical protein